MEAVDGAAPALVAGGLPWPAARGARLLRVLTAAASEAAGDATDAVDEPTFEVDMCVPAPGHVALVLARKPGAGGQLPRESATDASAPAAAPRVVFVLDAVPPKAATPSRGQQSGESTSSSTSSTNSAVSTPRDGRRTQGSTPRAAGTPTSTPPRPKTSKRLALAPVQDVDELELVEELLAMPRATGGDGAVLAKTPLLCARFDCRVVGVRFVRAEPASAREAAVAAPPLRCVVAREDGMAFLWEWRADLHQWTFMNRFCFLENPNLAWTKPVVAFAAAQSALTSAGPLYSRSSLVGPLPAGVEEEEEAGGRMELAWWSTEVKHEPKLWQRSVRFVREANTFRTDVVVGSAHTVLPTAACADVEVLLASKLGFWALSTTTGVFFRGATSLTTLAMSWAAATLQHERPQAQDAAVTLGSVVTCLHNVTGELLVLERASGVLSLVTPQSAPSPHARALHAKRLATLAQWHDSADGKEPMVVREIAGHRHLLLVLAQRGERLVLHVHSLVTGERLESMSLPSLSSLSYSRSSSPVGKSVLSPLNLWVMTGRASATGFWSPTSFWTLRLPTAKQVAVAHRVGQRNPTAAFAAVKDYGESTRLDAALFALDSLEQAVAVVATPAAATDGESSVATRMNENDPKWRAAIASMSNPALLLALLTSSGERMPVALVSELAALVSAVHEAARELTGDGQQALGSSLGGQRGRTDHRKAEGDADPTTMEAARRLLTPANLESLRHLANWILLAKRKIARLQTSAAAEPTSVDGGVGAGKKPDRARRQQPQGGDDDDRDASNFRLSRKLRPMSNLRFAAQSCAVGEHGRLWLEQLEAFLLADVPFKTSPGEGGDAASTAMPSHLLFHEERVLDDYGRHGGAPSFSKHMYLESLSRLYLLHEPEALVQFVACVEKFCPRLFSLSGHAHVARSHAERSLSLLPALELFVAHVRQNSGEENSAAARASLEAYVQLLCHCEQWVEAARALLDCGLYEPCKTLVLTPLLRQTGEPDKEPSSDGEGDVRRADRVATTAGVYFALLEYCVRHCDADELAALVAQKPRHVEVLTLLQALRGWLTNIRGADAATVTVGKLRPVLATLLAQQHKQRQDNGGA